MRMSLILAAAFVLASPMPANPPALSDWGKDPTVNLSAIRHISCDNPDPTKRGWTGSGAMIADSILMTAKHVAEGKNCKDTKTGKKASMYYSDETTDFALMHINIKGIPPVKYSCARLVTGNTYQAYGYSRYMQKETIFRQSNMLAYPGYSGPYFQIDGVTLPYMRKYYGPMVPGMSGGPVIDPLTGVARGINNAGLFLFNMFVTGKSYSTELADTVLCNR